MRRAVPIPYRPHGPLWHGADPCFLFPFERDARRYLDEQFSREAELRLLRYRVSRLTVPGDPKPHNLTIEFWEQPPYDTFGLLPQDYPRVFTSVDRPRKHYFPDTGALCLWFPNDPPARRWTSDHGLRLLVEVVRRHLLLELHWLLTGQWASEDTPHGFPKASQASNQV